MSSDKLFCFLKPFTENLTFITLKPGTTLGLENYQVPADGLDVPLITLSLAENIKRHQEDKVINSSMIIKGIGYLLGIDTSFSKRMEYEKLIAASGLSASQIWLKEAIDCQKEEQFEEALIFARAVSLFEPETEEALLLTGVSSYQVASRLESENIHRKNLISESLLYLELLYEKGIKNPLCNYYLGLLYRESKTYNKAMEVWKEAESMEMSEEEKALLVKQIEVVGDLAIYENGYQAALQNKGAEALEWLLPLVERHQSWWNLHFFVGLAYEQTGSLMEAIKYYDKVIEIKGYHEETYLQLINIYLIIEEPQKALSMMEELLRRNKNSLEMKCKAALIACVASQYQRSKSLVEEVEKLDPNFHMLKIVKQQIQTLSKS
ncbi:tetratricopeptide repeat protein [Tindallia californiensis]|uniref:Tetratricopeptide repeat-containing protein n=1 Tax=Tindallia californiensis TaxID=159292 RepID=A0A1H3JJ71_9FIRM|nr:hypothetical protein [Tindallia californiensis]SDY40050.1 hypothetical protein SAMN05192546_1023 [Tindallia californiensis]